jgi:flagellar motor component MotA
VGAYKEAEQTLIASVDALADKVEGRSALVLDAEHDVDTFVENIFRPALVITLKAENHRLRRGLEEIVSTAESDPENQHAMNSYSAGYSGGLEEQAQRAREVLLEKDSHTQPNY